MAVTTEENEILTRVGRGTAGGDLLRRYWHPIAAESEMVGPGTKRVKLLGEELVLFRDGSGGLGLVQESCAHRRVSLKYGVPEQCGIRCSYHGWLYDSTGQCTEQPCEPERSRFAEKVRIQAYPVQPLGGLIFAYLGPDPAPLLPRWDLYVEDGRVARQIAAAVIPCNWFQIMENSVDPYHTEWLHGRFFEYVLRSQGRDTKVPERMFAKHVKVAWDEFEYGIVKRRIRTTTTELDDDWTTGHPLVFPNFLKVGIGTGRRAFQIRVPMDDENTLHFWYDVIDVPAAVRHEPQTEIPLDRFDFLDNSGEFRVDHVRGQDIMAFITQGRVTDRTVERLGTSDRGVRMFRDIFLAQAQLVQSGESPMCTFRDADENVSIRLPVEHEAGARPDDATLLEYWRSSGFEARWAAPAVTGA